MPMPTDLANPSAATRRAVLLLSFATFSSMAVQRICDAMLPELSRVFAVGLAQAAQVVSVFAVVYGVAQLVYGPLGDRLGKFRVITWGAIGCFVACLAAALATSLDQLVAARAVMALGAAAIIPLSLAWVGDSVPADHVQETLARVGLGTTLGLGSGQLLGGLLTDALGWRWAFGCMALPFGVVAVLLHAHSRGQPPVRAVVDQSASGRPGFLSQAGAILTGRWSRIVLLVGLVEGAAALGVVAVWASHLHRTFSLSLTASGAIVALFGVGGALYMASARHLIPRLGQSGLAAVGVALLGLATVVTGTTPLWTLTIPASLLAGFGFAMFHNTMQTNAAQMAPHARGTAVALFAGALFLGQSLGVLVAAGLMERIGSGPVLMLGGGVMVAAGWFFASRLRLRGASAAAR